MDAEQKPLHPALVFAKTAKGTAEIATRSGTLSLPMRRILIMIDGKRPVRELLPLVRAGELEKTLAALTASGMIEESGHAALGAAEPAGQPQAAQVKMADAVEPERRLAATPAAPIANPPAAAAAPMGNAPGTVLANVLANVSSPPTVTNAARPATLSGAPRPPTLNGVSRPPALSEPRAAVPITQMPSQMSNGQPRPPTLGGTFAQKTTATPPTLSGAARPPTLTGNNGNNGTAMTMAPARPATLSAAPAATPAAAEPTLEESKRMAVRELYDRLGPYGEEPAARIQSCTTLEALRDELRYAGKRVATFRGEKAAQEYLASMARVAAVASA